jgi:uncharacterized iron-regulated membrane protein
MMKQASIRRWFWVHKWTSLISTLFLLLLCVTGLPLIFHDEIDRALGADASLSALPAGTPHLDLDKLAAAAKQLHPDQVIRFVSFDQDEQPDAVFFSLAPKVDSPPNVFTNVTLDARTAQAINNPGEGVVKIIYNLHTDLFVGLPGKLFLGFMGLLLLASLVSGTVLYAPFMRKLAFGTVRKNKTKRIRWLDLHNLLGVATLLWLFVVGATGVINCCAELVFQYWQFDQIGAMAAPYRDKPAVTEPGSLEKTLQTARAAAPDMRPRIVAYPGTFVSSRQHYMVFMAGNTPLTKKLGKPLLIDATTAQLTDMRDSPLYLTALLISQPLHFGDYGGMPFKILWALFDAIAIVVLGSGVYLWWKKRRLGIDARLADLDREIDLGGAAAGAVR